MQEAGIHWCLVMVHVDWTSSTLVTEIRNIGWDHELPAPNDLNAQNYVSTIFVSFGTSVQTSDGFKPTGTDAALDST